MDPRENPGIQPCRLNGLQQFVVRIPPARFLDVPERLCRPKRFLRDSGVAGSSKEQRNRYYAFVLPRSVGCVVKSTPRLINHP